MLNEKRRTFNPAQAAGLEQRMALLESFMSKSRLREKQTKRFSAGQITIVDLSDPFIDPASACGIFEIILRLFVRAKVDTGKVLVVDEAHKVGFPCSILHLVCSYSRSTCLPRTVRRD